MSDVILELEITKSQSLETEKYMLKMNVIRYENIDAEIFVYRRNTSGTDEFYTVASPVHMLDFPKNQPDRGSVFYRDKLVELAFDTAKLMEEYCTRILDEVRQLKEDWQIVEGELNKTYTVVI